MTILIYTLIVTQITIAAVTLYLHRSQAHKAVQFHPALNHFFRLWLWLTTGMNTKEWVAVHRKHHQAADTEADPHSPKIHGIWKIFLLGAYYYVKAKKDPETLKLGVGTPNDWAERKVYTPFPYLGIVIMLAINVLLFGAAGVLVWLVQMWWIPFWAAGVVNGLCHWWGYRNYDTSDTSRNLLPWGFWIGGEELHNGHHGDGASAKFSKHWWEFDIGWMYITILKKLRLAKVRRIAS